MTRFRTLLADPPWSYHGGGAATRYLARRQYRPLATAALCALPVGALCHPAGATLLLWCPWPKLADGVRVMEAWGFRHTSGLPWVKTNVRAGTVRVGPGYHVRQVSECLLIGLQGAARAPEPSRRLVGLITAPCTSHSRKPAAQYEYAERYPGPYAELFHRPAAPDAPPRPGWTLLGDAVTGRDIADDLADLTDLSARVRAAETKEGAKQ